MAIFRWIGDLIGFMSEGFLGALVLYMLGTFFKKSWDAMNKESGEKFNKEKNSFGNTYNQSAEREYYNRQRRYQDHQNFEERWRQNKVQPEEYRNAFLLSMLIISAYIIRADGRVMHSEMNVMRAFLRNNFGEISVIEGDEMLRRVLEKQKQMGAYEFEAVIKENCNRVKQYLSYNQRLQLLHFLIEIAKADGQVVQSEVQAIKNITLWIGLSLNELFSMFNLSENTIEAAYRVLGISPDATDEEVRRAYRQMVLKHHPDKVASLGEDIKRAAERKLQEINDAKAKIDNERRNRS